MNQPRPVGTAQLAAVALSICSLAAATVAETMPAQVSGNALVTAPVDTPDNPSMYVLRVRDNLQPAVVRVLALAYPLAVKRVRTVVSCRALFERLGAGPVQSLMNSRYRAASPVRQSRADPCQYGAVAFTGVGSPDVRLCLKFGSLPVSSAAVVLLHEALHYAGLGEWPSTPHAMTSGQINLMVREACGL